MITQSKLKEILDYDIDTGVFTWKVSASSSVSVGSIAGAIDNKGYRRIGLNRTYKRAHRLAWFYVYGEWPKSQIDHINRNRDDNMLSNLRAANDQQNCRNRSPKINKFGVIGLSWCKRSKRFFARITIDRKTEYLGYFSDMFEAICARKSAENKYFNF